MKKILLMVLCVLLSGNVAAKELAGVALAENAQVGGKTLVLNGAGIRTRFVFDIYVIALYLPAKTTKADAVMADANTRRVALHILRSLKSATLLDSFKKAIARNRSEAEMSAMDAQLRKFYAAFDAVPEVKKGDAILFDYQPDSGTRITVNGTERGVIDGAAFNRALLEIWLGDKPVNDELKKALLGI